MNSERFRQWLSSVYASATFSGSREFQASSASRTFWMAVSRVNGGSGGRVAILFLLIRFVASPSVADVPSEPASHDRAQMTAGGDLPRPTVIVGDLPGDHGGSAPTPRRSPKRCTRCSAADRGSCRPHRA